MSGNKIFPFHRLQLGFGLFYFNKNNIFKEQFFVCTEYRQIVSFVVRSIDTH